MKACRLIPYGGLPFRLMLLTGLLTLGAFAQGCQSPCHELADIICHCEDNDLEEQGCVTSNENSSDQLDISDADEEACQAILDTGSCTCAALEKNDYAACGLSRE